MTGASPTLPTGTDHEERALNVDAAIAHFRVPSAKWLASGWEIGVPSRIDLVRSLGNDTPDFQTCERRIEAEDQPAERRHVRRRGRGAVKPHIVIGCGIAGCTESVGGRDLEARGNDIETRTKTSTPPVLDRGIADLLPHATSVGSPNTDGADI